MTIDPKLLIQHAWCSGCDRQVKVTVHPAVIREGRAPTPEDLVCLEHGDTCTGELCPIFDVPSKEMKRRYQELLDQAARKAEDAS